MRRHPDEIRLSEFRRIIVCGPPGSGKTSLAKELATRCSLTYVELDSLFWEPGWVQATDSAFFERIEKSIEPEGWVVDGNYTRTRHLTLPKAQLVIWLHFPLPITFWRLLGRTVRRAWKKQELWPGCRENWRAGFFSFDSILIWLLKTHRRNHKKMRQLEQDPACDHITLISFHRLRHLDSWMKRCVEH